MACLGQQNVEGKRISPSFWSRSLPHFLPHFPWKPHTKGFIKNSFCSGLDPYEFFFHAMAGREGEITKYMTTKDTGYIQRRLMKALEDVSVRYDGTVRTSQDKVIQFVFGEDGLDPLWVESEVVEMRNLTKQQFHSLYHHGDIDSEEFGAGYLAGDMAESVRNSYQERELIEEEFQQLMRDRKMIYKLLTRETHWFHCCNIKRLIQMAAPHSLLAPSSLLSSPPAFATIINGVKSLNKQLCCLPQVSADSVELFNIIIRSTLASKRVLSEFRLRDNDFEWVLGEIQSRMMRALVQPGEMVGAVAAQSIGEPTTQMTLNAFHFAGVAARNTTLGVPRLVEILNITPKLKTPSMRVFLTPNCATNSEVAKLVLWSIQHTTLRALTKSIEINYDGNPNWSAVGMEKLPSPEDFYPWKFSLVDLDEVEMAHRLVAIADIGEQIKEQWGEDLYIEIDSDAYAVHIWKKKLPDHKEDIPLLLFWDLKNKFLQALLDTTVKGMKGVKSASLEEVRVPTMDEEGCVDVRREWVVETEGINFLNAFPLPHVDFTRSTCNDISAIFQV